MQCLVQQQCLQHLFTATYPFVVESWRQACFCRQLTVCSDTSHVAPPPMVDTSNADEQGKLPDLAGAFKLIITALPASVNLAEVSSRTAGRHSPRHCTGLMPTPGSQVSSRHALLGWHTRPPLQLFGRKGSQMTSCLLASASCLSTALVWQYSMQEPSSSHLSWPSEGEQEQLRVELSMEHFKVLPQSLSFAQRPCCKVPAGAEGEIYYVC